METLLIIFALVGCFLFGVALALLFAWYTVKKQLQQLNDWGEQVEAALGEFYQFITSRGTVSIDDDDADWWKKNHDEEDE